MISRPVQRTYGSRAHRSFLASSPPPSDFASSSPAAPPLKRKRPLRDGSLSNLPDPTPSPSPPKKRKTVGVPYVLLPSRASTLSSPSLTLAQGHKPVKAAKSSKPKHASQKQRPAAQKLTQLHFTLDTSVLRTCPLCELSYTRAAPDDEALHRSHCARVRRGMEWGRDEEREARATEIASGLRLKGEQWRHVRGRIVSVRLDVGGKTGAKLGALLQTINLALSSPPLPPAALKACKAYLFLVPTPASSSLASTRREKIAGCVIAQRIDTAMRVATEAELPPSQRETDENVDPTPPSGEAPAARQDLVAVDLSSGLYVHPEPLPTAMGIPRLFVSSTYRRCGIAMQLLDAAARTFIHSCPLDPRKGEVAFTQPTSSGRAVMLRWGQGAVRIYDEGQGVDTSALR